MRTVTDVIPSEALHCGTNSKEKSPAPRACRLDKVDFYPGSLFELFVSADNKVVIQALHVPHNGASRRMASVDGDSIWFIHTGSGTCDTTIGSMPFASPAYLFIPRSFTYRIRALTETFLVGIESSEPLERPYFTFVNDTVPWNEHALTTPTPARGEFIDSGEKGDYKTPVYPVWVKRAHAWTQVIYKHSPFSCVGYQGYPYPFVLKTEDISLPVLSKEHTDPTSFMTFCSPPPYGGLTHERAPNVAVSTFLPHRMHSPPYFHTNLWDEVLFISGTYPARGGVLGSGDMSFHPQGFLHGPQPHFLKDWKKPGENTPPVEMLAVMFESKSPLLPTQTFAANEIHNYWKSWTEEKGGK